MKDDAVFTAELPINSSFWQYNIHQHIHKGSPLNIGGDTAWPHQAGRDRNMGVTCLQKHGSFIAQ